MKISVIIRLLALICAVAILSGCGFTTQSEKKAAEHTQPVTEPPTEPVSVQEPMPQAQLQEALTRAEYAMIAAAFCQRDAYQSLRGLSFWNNVCVGDLDGDHQLELMIDDQYACFDIDNNRDFNCELVQTSVSLYVDEEGNFYKGSLMMDGWPEEMDEGYYHCWEYTSEFFCTLKDGQWTSDLHRYKETLQEAWDNDDGIDFLYGDYLQYDASYEIEGQPVTEEAYNARRDALTKITTKAQDYTVIVYDAVYANSLLSALESRFSGDFGATSLRQDMDGDGVLETVIAVPGLLEPYRMGYTRHENDLGYYPNAMDAYFNPDYDYTGILVADVQGDQLKLTAYCALFDVTLHDGVSLTYRDNHIWIDDMDVYAPADFDTLEGLTDADRGGVYQGLVSFLESNGYSQIAFKTADVGDAAGSELLCLCQKDGMWQVLIFVFRNGQPFCVFAETLNSTAVYLTETEGRQAVLSYMQSIYTGTNGETHTNYSFNVYRFDETGKSNLLDDKYIGYSDDDEDATAVAEFFSKLNNYLVKIVAIGDPFQLNGNQWLLLEETDYGTPPSNIAEQEEYAMGFVQIRNPSSWLNLREGPGTEYPCILMDPANPDSFVRQALGSPVTILETIETGDAENPVWVRVRITYADKVIEGYSSKTYIRLADE